MRNRLILSLLFAMAFFQNCGSGTKGAVTLSETSAEEVVVPTTANFTKIVYDPELERVASGGERIEIDVDAGVVTIPTNSCVLDNDRLSRLRDLLASSKVCKPLNPPGSAQCLALVLADIQLSDDSSEVRLRGVTCGYGTFLCNGADTALRSLLDDVKQNPCN